MHNKLFPTVLGRTLLPPVELGLDLPDVASPSDDIEVRINSDHSHLLLVASVVDPDTDSPVLEFQVPQSADGYAARIRIPEGLWKVIVTAVAQRPAVSVSDFVFVMESE